jgi:multimeric flavodoxin WrbA
MKILLINGSPRKGNTLEVIKKIEKYLIDSNHETEIIHIKEYDIKTCVGCYRCVLDGREKCPFIADDTDIILKKMIIADGIVLSAPVFALGIPGYFKNFFDRIAYNGHRPEMYNKPTLVVSTTAGMGTEYVIQQLKRLDVIGLKIIDSIGFLVYPTGKDTISVSKKKESEIIKVIKKFKIALINQKNIKPKVIQIIQFYGLKLNSNFGKSVYKADYEYFKNKDFFIESNIHPIKRIIGKMVYKIGMSSLKKTINLSET